MVIFSRFQTELFAYSPLSAASCSVVDSFNLLNAISAFCSSRRSGLVLTLSPQQITVIPKGLGAGVQDPLCRREDKRSHSPQTLWDTASGAGCMLGLFGAALAPAPGQASSTWCLPAREEKKKNTLLQKLSLPHPRGWQRSGHSPGHSVPRMEHGCRVTPEQGEHRAEIPPEQGSWGALRQEREAPTAPGEQPLLFLVSTLLAAALHGRCQPWSSTKLAAEEAPMPLQVIF